MFMNFNSMIVGMSPNSLLTSVAHASLSVTTQSIRLA